MAIERRVLKETYYDNVLDISVDIDHENKSIEIDGDVIATYDKTNFKKLITFLQEIEKEIDKNW